MVVELLIPGVVILLLVYFAIRFFYKLTLPKYSHKNKVVLITGGSEGIGQNIVEEILSEGAKTIIIMSRSEDKLNSLVNNLKKVKKNNQEILFKSCDVSDKIAVTAAFDWIKDRGVTQIDFCYLLHGLSIPKYFVEQSEEEFEKQINVNYLGCVFVAKKVIPIMLQNKDSIGHVIFTGSTLSFCSFIGYSSYSPTKYAVRALAETLYNEYQGQNIQIHLACPSDTKTPGYENENKTKPEECKKISDSGSVYESYDVAKSIVRGVTAGDFYVYHDTITGLIIKASRGMGPSRNIVWELLISPILFLLTIFGWYDWRGTSLAGASTRTKRWEANLKPDVKKEYVEIK
jgi:3-dehydrosphinganine reductase